MNKLVKALANIIFDYCNNVTNSYDGLYNHIFMELGSVNVKVKKLNENAVIPKYAMPGDCGMDLTAIDYEIDEYGNVVYHTGLAFEIPEGYAMFIFPRSSNKKTNFYMTNHVGIIDSGYRGEILITYKNRDSRTYMEDPVPYKIGDRIAQLVIMPYPKVFIEVIDELSQTERGEGGHGSTGR